MDVINRYTEEIKDTLQGIGSDENALINISVKITHKERMKIRQAYKSMFGEDFMDVLKSYYKGNYRKMLLALYTDPVEYDVDLIYKAINGAGTDEDVLIEILASRPGWYLNKIKDKDGNDICYPAQFDAEVAEMAIVMLANELGSIGYDVRKMLEDAIIEEYNNTEYVPYETAETKEEE